jgi:hypothetical protein
VSQVTLARNRSLHFLDTQQPRVLHLEPIGRAAGTISGVFPLRDNSFQTELAGVAKYGLAIAFDMLVEPDARASLGHMVADVTASP